jgi:hypothetical protein
MSKLTTIITATALLGQLAYVPALAETLLPVPEPPARPGPLPATPGGYLTCSIARFCLGQDGQWTPQPAAVEPLPVPQQPGPEPTDSTNSGR